MSNKDYIGFFHKLHCILRDGEVGITGLAALNEINNMVFMIFIEQYSKKYEMSDNEKFSYVYGKYIVPYLKTTLDTEKNKIMDKFIDKYDEMLINLYNNQNTKKYIFSDTNKLSAFSSLANNNSVDNNTYNGAVKQLIALFQECKLFFYDKETNITEKVISDAFEQIDFDLLGDAYEKFKEDEVGNTGKTNAQYFSPRCAIRFIIDELLKPTHKDKTYDSSCGSGGFIHFMNKYVLGNSTKKQHEQFKLNIYANDKTPEIMKPLYINMFLHDIPVDKICNKNSLSASNCMDMFESIDCIPGNPPYGMSIKANPQDYIMTVNSNKYNYWPNFMIQSKLKLVLDSTSQFIIHTINSLKVNGRFGLIIDRGIINNGNENNSFQKKLREWILTVCDLQYIILLPKGIFTTTQFDTAIIYGIKKIGLIDSYTSKHKPSTPKVKYCIGNFEDCKNKTGLKVDLDKPDIELEIKDIVNKDWSLKYDDYIEKKDEQYNGILYKTLGEVCEFKRGKSLTIDKMKGGTYQVIGGGVDLMSEFYHEYNTEANDIIMSNDGSYAGYINRFDNKLFLTSHCNRCIINSDNINASYLFYYLKFMQSKLIIHENKGGYQKGQAQPSINIPKMYKEIKIPILPSEHQQRIVDFMTEHIGSNYNILDRLTQEFKDIDLFKFLLYEDYESFDLIIQIGREMLDYDTKGKQRFNTRRRWCFDMIKSKCKEMKLGELVETKRGKTITKAIVGKNPGNYPVIGGGIKPFGYYNKYNMDELTILISQSGANAGYVSVYPTKVWASDCFAVKTINKSLVEEYLYNYLQVNSHNFTKKTEDGGLQSGQAQPHVYEKDIKKLLIPIPSKEDQEQVIKNIEEINKEEKAFLNKIEILCEQVHIIIKNFKKEYKSTDNEDIDDIESYSDAEYIESDKEPKESDTEYIESDKELTESEYESVTLKGIDYYLYGEKLYTIKDGQKDKLYAEKSSTGNFKKVDAVKKPSAAKSNIKIIDNTNEDVKETKTPKKAIKSVNKVVHVEAEAEAEADDLEKELQALEKEDIPKIKSKTNSKNKTTTSKSSA